MLGEEVIMTLGKFLFEGQIGLPLFGCTGCKDESCGGRWVKGWDDWPHPLHVKVPEISCHGFMIKILGSKN